ncbi:hypothetical protein ACROYT_G020126 [Oculina patagonica]
MDLAKLTVWVVVVIEIFHFGVDGKERCSCYTFENGTSTQGFSWPQANVSCEYYNKHLVVMETEREWEFIYKEIQTRKGARYDEWLIGLYKILKTGEWTWVNGKPLTIDKWQPNKPKDMEYYALIAKEWPVGKKGLFNSIQGNVFRGWICEEETDNCQVGCFFHNYPMPTNSTPAESTTPTTQIQRKSSTPYGHTDASDFTSTTSAPGATGQTGDNDNSSTIVIIAASLAAVLFVVLIVFAVVLLLRRKKRRSHGKDAEIPQKKSSHQRAQLGENQYEPVDRVEAAKVLGTPDSGRAPPTTQKKDEYELPSPNCEYAVVNKKNRKRKEGDLVYAQLAEFDGDSNDTKAHKPPSYEPTVYADVDVVPPEVFSRTNPDSTQPTYANVETTGV